MALTRRESVSRSRSTPFEKEEKSNVDVRKTAQPIKRLSDKSGAKNGKPGPKSLNDGAT
jgi:hypothetical protein